MFKKIDWEGFDVPEQRMEDWGWLNRNFSISAHNRNHERFAEVKESVRFNFRLWCKQMHSKTRTNQPKAF